MRESGLLTFSTQPEPFWTAFSVQTARRMPEFLDVVNQAVQLPLDVDLPTTAERKSIESLLRPDVPEYRLYDAQSSAVDRPALWRVDLGLHRVGQAAGASANKDMNLP